MLYLLDSDHFSLLYRRGTEGRAIQSRLRLHSPDDYGISIITYSEATKGWLAEVARARTPEQEVRAFAEMEASLAYCMGFAIWSYTPEAAALCALWKTQKVRVGTQDLRIAAVAVASNAVLLTRNARDFTFIPGLHFEDWAT